MTHLHVLLISPVPPPRGGIGTWTELMVAEAKSAPDLCLELIDIAPRWRSVHQMEVWRRCIGGGLQLIRDGINIWLSIALRRPDCIHICTSGQLAFLRDIFVLRLARRKGIRTVYHLHFGRVPDLVKRGSGWEWKLCRLALNNATVTLVLDQKTFDSVVDSFKQTTVRKFTNCLNIKELERKSQPNAVSDKKPGLLRVTYIGWIIPTKGVLELVLAASRFGEFMPFELELVGPADPRYLAEIREAAKPLQERLLLRGEQEHGQAMQLLRQSDVFALPSYTEGFPNVVLEAMALGKPIIGTDVGAIAEMLHDDGGNLCGVVVPPKDVIALEQALRRLLADDSLRKSMGELAAANFNVRYRSDIIFKQLTKIWSGEN